MAQANLLSVDDLIHELDTGRATVKFILDRFSALLGHGTDTTRYPSEILPVLMEIRNLMASGLLPSQIQEIMERRASSPGTNRRTPDDVRMSPEALGLIQGLFQEICAHQDRVAQAHEKRAEVEERKALAIEKRAEAEEKKAAAMNNIAAALQEMNQLRAIDAQSMEIAGQTARALTMTDTPVTDDLVNKGQDTGDLDATDLDTLLDEDPDLLFRAESVLDPADPDISDHDPGQNRSEPQTGSLDDLSALVDEPGLSPRDLDDLSALIDSVSGGGNVLETEPEPPPDLPDLDDLAELVDEAADPGDAGLDDLSALVDIPEIPQDPSPDDLSALVDEPGRDAVPRDIDDLYSLVSDAPGSDETLALDDLSALVDQPSSGNGSPAMDDLSALVDSADASVEKAPDMDDLSALVDSVPVEQTSDASESLDDLSGLVDGSSDDASAASLRPDITPEQDMAKYKAAVMQIIIDLKSRGLSAEETTERLNRDDVPTLSGKPHWRESAIAKIYGFIDSAK